MQGQRALVNPARLVIRPICDWSTVWVSGPPVILLQPPSRCLILISMCLPSHRSSILPTLPACHALYARFVRDKSHLIPWAAHRCSPRCDCPFRLEWLVRFCSYTLVNTFLYYEGQIQSHKRLWALAYAINPLPSAHGSAQAPRGLSSAFNRAKTRLNFDYHRLLQAPTFQKAKTTTNVRDLPVTLRPSSVLRSTVYKRLHFGYNSPYIRISGPP